MMLSDQFWEMAEHFMEVVRAETGFPVLIYDDKGYIVRATDTPRIGDRHAGAEKIMQGLVDEYAVTPAEAARNPLVREGYNRPIVVDGRRVAAFGITGKLELVKPLAKVAVRLIDSWIADQKHKEQLERSARKYRRIFDHSPQGIFQSTLDGRMLTANAALAKIHAYPSPAVLLSEMTDMAHQLYVNPEDRQRLIEQLQDKGRVTGFLAQCRRREGRIIDVCINAHFVSDPETGRRLIEGMVEDVTQAYAREQKIREHEAFLEGITTNLPGMVYQFHTRPNQEYELCFVSAKAADIFGLDVPLEKFFAAFIRCIPEDERDDFMASVRASYETVSPWHYEGRFIKPTGATMWFSGNSVPHRDGDDVFFDGVLLDITDIKAAQEEIRQRRQFLESVLYHAPDAIVTLDATHRVIDWNQGAVQIFGYTPDEAIGTLLDDLVARNTAHREAGRKTRQVLSGQRVEAFETIRYHKDGSPVHVIAAGSPIMVDDTLKGVVAVYTDITARKQAEKSLKESNERFLTVLESIDATIYVADMTTFEILYMNEQMKRVFGADLTGRTCWEVFRNGTQPCSACTNDQLIDENGNPTGVCVWEDKNPVTNRWYVNYDRAIKWVDGRIVRLQVATDITKQKTIETERKNYEARIQQMQKIEAIGMLAGGIAHDFNNILSAVIGFAELALIDTQQAPRVHANIQQIHSAGMRARDLVQQILTFSRQDERDLKPLQISILIKEALKMLRSSLPTTIEITPQISTRVDNVMADPTQIHQIVMNLCTNAAQAMEEDGGHLTVRLSQVTLTDENVRRHPGLKAGDYARLSVQDTGIGIPADIVEKIFHPYFTTKEKGKGTGLGLAMVHGIVQSYGGEIHLDSVTGRGTTFLVYLPTIKAAAETLSKEAALPSGTERILFIDDEAIIVDIGRQALERLGYRVETCTSSVEALEHFRRAPDRFDLIITDMTMPKMTGDQLAGEILKLRADIPIIVCTGYSRRIDNQQIGKMGIRALLMKPLNLGDLALSVRRVLDHPA
ncbi:MAG: PAS domain S-box protein [Desulfosarcina sp.]|nr:PAS domain S-box protein [Desulfobacterales bacterium]